MGQNGVFLDFEPDEGGRHSMEYTSRAFSYTNNRLYKVGPLRKTGPAKDSQLLLIAIKRFFGMAWASLLLTLLLPQQGLGLSEAPQAAPVVSLCTVAAQPSRYHEKTVNIHARFSGTWEGYFLSDPAC